MSTVCFHTGWAIVFIKPSLLSQCTRLILTKSFPNLQKKTEFAQDKYKRRKAKKYITYLTPRKPTARMISEVRLGGLRLSAQKA